MSPRSAGLRLPSPAGRLTVPGFLATPLLDETLHSVLARTMRLLGLRMPLPFIRSAFGPGAVTVRPLMTGAVAEFVHRHRLLDIDVPRAVRLWTGLPYFEPFMPGAAASRLEAVLARGHRRGGYDGLGLTKGQAHWHRTLNFCLACRDQDLVGEPLPA